LAVSARVTYNLLCKRHGKCAFFSPSAEASRSAILSDVTTSATRSKALAHVGIAFAICFCIGPPIGAYFASKPLPASFAPAGWELNIYAAPAFLSLVLLVVETLFLMIYLPETRGKSVAGRGKEKSSANGRPASPPAEDVSQLTVPERLRRLKMLRVAHFLFLAIFSGVEFTLTFLSFDCTLLHPPTNR
jgi:MFS family permease